MNEELEIRNYQDRIADLEERIKELETICMRDRFADGYAAGHEDFQRVGGKRIKELEEAARIVCWFDWSDNDTDAVAAITELRRVLNDCREAT